MKRILPFLFLAIIAFLSAATYASVRLSPAIRQRLAQRGIELPVVPPREPATA